MSAIAGNETSNQGNKLMTREDRIEKEMLLDRILKRLANRTFYSNMIADAQLILKLAVELEIEQLKD